MTIYRSKIDHWMWMTIAVIFIASHIPVFINPNQSWETYLWLIISYIIPVFLIINIYTNTYYTIDEETLTLKVKSGFIVNSKYNINKITRIRKTNTWLSSPALSLDRIEITTGRYNRVVISPKDKAQFIAHLQAINPNISVEL